MANNNSIYRAKDIDTNNLVFEGPQANNYGGKFAKVRYNGGWLLAQTPRMVVPFGANVYIEEDKDGDLAILFFDKHDKIKSSKTKYLKDRLYRAKKKLTK